LTIHGPGADRLTVRGAVGIIGIIFQVDQHTVTISGLTLADASVFDVFNQGTLHLTDCVISHTPGISGSGIANAGGTLTLTHCIVRGNNVTGSVAQGGGIFNSGMLILDGSTVDRNTVAGTGTAGTIGGGGIYNSNTGTVQG